MSPTTAPIFIVRNRFLKTNAYSEPLTIFPVRCQCWRGGQGGGHRHLPGDHSTSGRADGLHLRIAKHQVRISAHGEVDGELCAPRGGGAAACLQPLRHCHGRLHRLPVPERQPHGHGLSFFHDRDPTFFGGGGWGVQPSIPVAYKWGLLYE